MIIYMSFLVIFIQNDSCIISQLREPKLIEVRNSTFFYENNRNYYKLNSDSIDFYTGNYYELYTIGEYKILSKYFYSESGDFFRYINFIYKNGRLKYIRFLASFFNSNCTKILRKNEIYKVNNNEIKRIYLRFYDEKYKMVGNTKNCDNIINFSENFEEYLYFPNLLIEER
ncbi:MAG: hypothetical protein SFU91_13320 [Chloroherpetonaceae bacterium]|nr:hypothetical protein [Chloroherpetonaceae bacterium]